MEVTVIPIASGVLGTVPKGLVGGGAGKVKHRKMNGDHLNYNIAKIG